MKFVLFYLYLYYLLAYCITHLLLLYILLLLFIADCWSITNQCENVLNIPQAHKAPITRLKWTSNGTYLLLLLITIFTLLNIISLEIHFCVQFTTVYIHGYTHFHFHFPFNNIVTLWHHLPIKQFVYILRKQGNVSNKWKVIQRLWMTVIHRRQMKTKSFLLVMIARQKYIVF